ncbi:MAG: HAMP domain-containing histidine kinase [Gemmatimonadetes bacterium]|nr:HAMP domain-containing histidine kinase [Gemmatimonadota bacterium]
MDLGEVVRGAVALVRQHPDAQDVAVACSGVDRVAMVAGDPDLLHRAIFNLLLNAAQYAGGGGRVRVVLKTGGRPFPRGTAIRSPVAVTVSDSGPGVAPEVRDRIFDPFFTTREGGSGLGLAVVYRALEAHDGSVFLDRSELGGAAFTIYLPAAEGSPGEEAA